jgi:hypothetical protein
MTPLYVAAESHDDWTRNSRSGCRAMVDVLTTGQHIPQTKQAKDDEVVARSAMHLKAASRQTVPDDQFDICRWSRVGRVKCGA